MLFRGLPARAGTAVNFFLRFAVPVASSTRPVGRRRGSRSAGRVRGNRTTRRTRGRPTGVRCRDGAVARREARCGDRHEIEVRLRVRSGRVGLAVNANAFRPDPTSVSFTSFHVVSSLFDRLRVRVSAERDRETTRHTSAAAHDRPAGRPDRGSRGRRGHTREARF